MYSIAISGLENASADPVRVRDENSDAKPDSGIPTSTVVASTGDDDEILFSTATTSSTSKDD